MEPLVSRIRIFTCDATSMYTNIDTDHALSTIAFFLRTSLICRGLAVEHLIQALKIILRTSIFKFGDTAWEQLEGSASNSLYLLVYPFHSIQNKIKAFIFYQALIYFLIYIKAEVFPCKKRSLGPLKNHIFELQNIRAGVWLISWLFPPQLTMCLPLLFGLPLYQFCIGPLGSFPAPPRNSFAEKTNPIAVSFAIFFAVINSPVPFKNLW
jgi:hypothetical protein